MLRGFVRRRGHTVDQRFQAAVRLVDQVGIGEEPVHLLQDALLDGAGVFVRQGVAGKSPLDGRDALVQSRDRGCENVSLTGFGFLRSGLEESGSALAGTLRERLAFCLQRAFETGDQSGRQEGAPQSREKGAGGSESRMGSG